MHKKIKNKKTKSIINTTLATSEPRSPKRARRLSNDTILTQPSKKSKVQPHNISTTASIQPSATLCSTLATSGIEQVLLPYLFNRTVTPGSTLRDLMNLNETSKNNHHHITKYLTELSLQFKQGTKFHNNACLNIVTTHYLNKQQLIEYKETLAQQITIQLTEYLDNTDLNNDQRREAITNTANTIKSILQTKKTQNLTNQIMQYLNETLISNKENAKRAARTLQIITILTKQDCLVKNSELFKNIKAQADSLSRNSNDFNVSIEATATLEALKKVKNRG